MVQVFFHVFRSFPKAQELGESSCHMPVRYLVEIKPTARICPAVS